MIRSYVGKENFASADLSPWRIERVSLGLNLEEIGIALERHCYNRLVACYVKRPRAVVNHPHGITADIDLGFARMGDVDVLVLDDRDVNA